MPVVRSEVITVEMQSRLGAFDSQSPHLAARMLLFVLVCGGLVLLGKVGAQYHGNPDHIVFPGPVGLRPRDRALESPDEPAGGSVDDSDMPVNWYRLTPPLN